MQEIPSSHVKITDPFWATRLSVNAETAIYHQWHELEESRCIDNFRIAAGLKEGFREGWFFADSDAFKWLDAAARIYANQPSVELKARMDDFIDLLTRAQSEDGYLYTYNQIHFPGKRWENLLIEHELYCHGHLIEAAVSHFEATGEPSALLLGRKAADLLVRDFLEAAPDRTSGHEEIEIALLRLYRVTGHAPYLDLARVLLERRGKASLHPLRLLQQNGRAAKRTRQVEARRKEYRAAHPGQPRFELPPENYAKKPAGIKFRWMINALTGKYFQLHAPIRRQTVPVGHAVRFGYLETAVAMLYRITCDESLLPAMQAAWEDMLTRRMYLTGGLGALPDVEGFGRDYELDPETAYAETCAALASLFWNWELAQIQPEAKYSDLFEWQLYNAALVGMGLGGDTYLYNNPLLCRGGIARRTWYRVPCCPSNLSRTLASLGRYIYSYDQDNLCIHQLIGNELSAVDGPWGKVKLESGLPWSGKVHIQFELSKPAAFTLRLRLPSWASQPDLSVNELPQEITPAADPDRDFEAAASGYDPRRASFVALRRLWHPGDALELNLDLPIQIRRPSPRLRRQARQVALTRGPLVYCLESLDNPGLDLFKARIDLDSIRVEPAPELLGGIQVLRGRTIEGQPITAIPYHLWGNRGESQMTVWLNS